MKYIMIALRSILEIVFYIVTLPLRIIALVYEFIKTIVVAHMYDVQFGWLIGKRLHETNRMLDAELYWVITGSIEKVRDLI